MTPRFECKKAGANGPALASECAVLLHVSSKSAPIRGQNTRQFKGAMSTFVLLKDVKRRRRYLQASICFSAAEMPERE
ncbi:hypothetical protein ILFOPFJJ_00173 [Ensifer psoraleae]|nr:hypothetical protein [Sinorhizobium psoraleae]